MRMWTNATMDLGTSKILVYSKNGTLIMHEASFVALDEDGNVVEVGDDAKRMFGRVQNDVKVVKPVDRGTIVDEDSAFMMLNSLFKKYGVKGIFGTRIVATMGLDLSEGEEETFIQLLDRLGISRIHIIPSVMAIALHAGVNIMDEKGLMIVDMGAGKTDLGVVSMGEVVLSKRFEIGGNDFDERIVNNIRERFSMLISLETAEKLKIKLGKVDTEKIVGVDTKTGLPKEMDLPLDELRESLDEIMNELVENIRESMENMKPELVEDVYKNGIILAGGLSQLGGVEKKIMERTKMVVRKVDDPVHSAALGATKVFLNREFLKLTEVI